MDVIDRNKALQIYLIGTLGQIGLVCLAVFLSRRVVAVDYTTPAGMMAIALGGLSSALWGTVLSVKYKRKELSAVLMDFFGVLQRPGYYLLVFLFLFLDFFSAILGGGIAIEVWYTPIILFLKALVFGGIEEIGWRYFFQLVLQERWNYVASTLCTFVAWGIWHFAYFYVEGTLSVVDPVPFLFGLLTNCFILSAIFNVTRSLWLCVMAHALINVFSQIVVGGDACVAYVCRGIIIVLAIVLGREKPDVMKNNNDQET
uniref:CPBP family intramembrane glutamic endopeptidase n=1 Tax=Eubacterium cellulosolvens TaxID=29322 RepID=UPI000AEACC0C|nr:CPBP family intramembrane glutamic endopeptidase [[Eubacterium] cellulosolvens]